MQQIAMKFVQWDVPELEKLKDSRFRMSPHTPRSGWSGRCRVRNRCPRPTQCRWRGQKAYSTAR